jgi:hypothetical protein
MALPKIYGRLAFVHSLECTSFDEERKEDFYVRRKAMMAIRIEGEVTPHAWKMWSRIQELLGRKGRRGKIL